MITSKKGTRFVKNRENSDGLCTVDKLKKIMRHFGGASQR